MFHRLIGKFRHDKKGKAKPNKHQIQEQPPVARDPLLIADVWGLIFSFLGGEDLITVGHTSWDFRKWTQRAEFWSKLFVNQFHFTPELSPHPAVSHKHFYVGRMQFQFVCPVTLLQVPADFAESPWAARLGRRVTAFLKVSPRSKKPVLDIPIECGWRSDFNSLSFFYDEYYEGSPYPVRTNVGEVEVSADTLVMALYRIKASPEEEAYFKPLPLIALSLPRGMFLIQLPNIKTRNRFLSELGPSATILKLVLLLPRHEEFEDEDTTEQEESNHEGPDAATVLVQL